MVLSGSTDAENGSVLFWVLVAVALLAALSFALMDGSRSGTAKLTDEQAQLAASEILAYADTVAKAVQKLRLRGCADTEISFENPVMTGYTNPNAPADKSCHVFDPAGGGLGWQNSNEAFLDNSKSAYPKYGEISITVNNVSILYNDTQTSGAELLLLYPYINLETCQMINIALNIYQNANEPANVNGVGSIGVETPFNGSYWPVAGMAYIDHPDFRRRLDGCFKFNIARPSNTNVGTSYSFYQVLIAR